MKKTITLYLIALSLILIGCKQVTTPENSDDQQSTTEESITKDEDKIYDSLSEEGRLLVEPVEDGIKVTVKLLDSDIATFNGKLPISFPNFAVTETSSKLSVVLTPPTISSYYYEQNPEIIYTNVSSKEVSQVFPFVDKDKTYTFELIFQAQSNYSEDIIPFHREYASCTATNNCLKLEDYFDYDYAPNKASIYADDKACLHISKDVSKFFKPESNASNVYLSGSVIAGKTDWSKSEWINNWISKINYNQTSYDIGADYKEMLSEKGADISKDLFKTTIEKNLDNYSEWGIDGKLFFTLEGKDYSFGYFNLKDANFDNVNWGKIIRTYTTNDSSQFKQLPNSYGLCPIPNNTKYIINKDKNDEATLTLTNNGNTVNFSLTEKNKTSPYKEGIFTWNATTGKLYIKFTKIDGKTYEKSLYKYADLWYYNLFEYYYFSSIIQMNYSINNGTITLSNTPIDSSNFKDLLLTESADGFKSNNNQDFKIYCGQRYIEVKVNNTSKTYVILEINDQNMVVCELHNNNDQSYLGPKFSIPYTFNESITENTLTLKIDGTNYTLQYYPNTANTTIFLPQ